MRYPMVPRPTTMTWFLAVGRLRPQQVRDARRQDDVRDQAVEQGQRGGAEQGQHDDEDAQPGVFCAAWSGTPPKKALTAL